jgi:hypothetical protein
MMHGYLMSGSLRRNSLAHSELILAGSMVAKGATRQATNHLKASISVGNSVGAVRGLVEVAEEVAKWNGSTLPGKYDVLGLAEEVQKNLKNEGGVGH